jgi:hypothetical protein
MHCGVVTSMVLCVAQQCPSSGCKGHGGCKQTGKEGGQLGLVAGCIHDGETCNSSLLRHN